MFNSVFLSLSYQPVVKTLDYMLQANGFRHRSNVSLLSDCKDFCLCCLLVFLVYICAASGLTYLFQQVLLVDAALLQPLPFSSCTGSQV